MRLGVLIVEDSEDDALLLVRELRRTGHDVVWRRVEDEKSLRRALSETTWDVILADYSLPHFGGVEALRIVKSLGIDVPFIMVSGTITDEAAVRAMKAGAQDYVMKDNLSRLVPAVEREIKDAVSRRERDQTLAKHEELQRLHTELALAARLRQSLISVGQDLASTLNFDEVLTRAVCEGARVLGADTAALEVRTEQGWLVRESYGLVSSLRGLRLDEEEAPLAMMALKERKAFAIADAAADPRLNSGTLQRYPMSSALVVPLLLRDTFMGVLLFGRSTRREYFQEAHLEFARNFSLLIALALSNAGLYEEQRTLAHKLETVLLNIPEELPGIKISHIYCSATHHAQVGGDFYDVFENKYGQIGLLIGDVCGHGVEAARIALLVKDSVHAFSHQYRRPHVVLRETNRLLVRKNLPGFVTVFLGFLDVESGLFMYSSAGHPPPLLVQGRGIRQLELCQPPLGVFSYSRYRDEQTLFEPGSRLLLYTDGVIEARHCGTCYGEDRLLLALSRHQEQPISAVPEGLLGEVREFCGDVLQDDAAMLAVDYGPSRPSARPNPV